MLEEYVKKVRVCFFARVEKLKRMENNIIFKDLYV